ncbi:MULTISPECIES: dTDP-4-dehydrorhamnose 3,5-epimerase [unclassified Campylobacter]|uniref:dTDP-4-dehydrorhamnose 3,5-epimerase n=1 Tax=unclassified Campylobacter TaxID=2593542 RepID=UPI003D35172E
MDGVILTPLKQIHHPKGDIFHAIKVSDNGYVGFGEAYFSTVKKGEIKGWKKHTKMILNLVVCLGEIKFTIYDEKSKDRFYINLSHKNYQRLTIQNGLWVCFEGIGDYNMLLNIANLEHDPNEAVSAGLDSIKIN